MNNRCHIFVMEPDGTESVYFSDEAPTWGENFVSVIFTPRNGAYAGHKHIIPFSRLSRIVVVD